jgi:uncharacterized protein
MKNFAGAIILFFIVLFAYTKLAGPIPFSVNSITTTKTDTFTVTGEGKASIAPDIAVINAGAQAQGATVKAAQDQLNKTINAISAAIKSTGVDNRDIQTSNYNINPTYDFSAGKQRITGYQASSNLTIKVRAVDRANAVIDAATAAGATNVGGINFDIDDKTKAQNEARQKAVADAKSKAENAARIAGFSLGKIINYSENFGNEPRPVPMMAKADMAGAGVPTQVEPGTSEIIVNVSLSYELR